MEPPLQEPPPSDTTIVKDLGPKEVTWLNINEHEDLAKCLNTCVDQWKNAGPEAWKKMFTLCAVAGIFFVVCHHGHVLVICDIICSGELYVLLI